MSMTWQSTTHDDYDPATAVDMVSEDRIVIGVISGTIDVANWSRPDNADTFRRR
jgi:hypothetical protein